MKQHITLSQLNQLGTDGKAELAKYAVSKQWSKHMESENNGGYVKLPLLSIGQMIEFLDEHRETVIFITKLNCHGDQVWSTGSFTCRGNHLNKLDMSKKAHNNDKELCDALWEAVKEVLNSDTV